MSPLGNAFCHVSELLKMEEFFFFLNKKSCRDFSGSPVIKNPLSTAEDVGSIPGQGTEISHAAGQLSPRAVTRGSLCTATKSRCSQR